MAKRLLKPENELLVVLMKLKLNLSEQFLAHLFGTSMSLISQMLSTYFCTGQTEQEELSLHYPDCFKKYHNVRAFIDSTEVPIQRPSVARANNSQIYSSYKKTDQQPKCWWPVLQLEQYHLFQKLQKVL